MIVQYNCIVDLLVPNRFFRTVWQGQRTILQGTSFATAYVTGIVSKTIAKLDDCILTKSELLDELATNTITIPKSKLPEGIPFKIEKAIVFPFNKESSTLVKYRNILDFELIGIYDCRISGNIGKDFGDITVENYDSIDWKEDFDTVIVSCHKTLSRLCKRDFYSEICEYALRYGKKIILFEKERNELCELYYPEISQDAVPLYNAGKMHKISIPTVGVFGTSSKQGKYTLQIELVNRIKAIGYNVGFLATEPSGCLMGADYTFHFGYHTYYDHNPRGMIATLNQMMWEIQNRGKDLIVSGCQSGTLHYDDSLIDNFAIYQMAFMLGTSPDFIILCINPHDDFEYIDRTINYLNAVNNGKVGAIVIFPIETQVKGIFNYRKEKKEIGLDAMNSLKEVLRKRYSISIYALNVYEDINELVNQILDFFAEE